MRVLAALFLLVCATLPALAAIQGTVGPYRVAISAEPAVITLGHSQLTLKVTDASSKPVTGAHVGVLVQMPGMPMGEQETVATPLPGSPGTYSAPAAFGMAGTYNATVTIQGPRGAAHGTIPLSTGQDTSGGAGFSSLSLLPWLVVVAIVAFVLYRMRRTGQRASLAAIANRTTIGGLVLLAVMLAIAVFAVAHWRRPGAMTPVQAQAMEMNTPAPPGPAPVTLARVERGAVSSTIRYTGQVVGYNEEDVFARSSGWLTWMPLYVGDHVRAGQVVARLDTSQLDPQVAEREAGVAMAAQSVDTARAEYRQSHEDVHRAHGEVASMRAALDAAKAQASAAREDRAAASEAVLAAQSKVADAQAQVQAAYADQRYWQQEIARERLLLDKGAVSREEYQREQAQAAGSDSKVHQAGAALQGAEADVRASQAAVRKADAMVAAAASTVATATADVQTHAAHVDSAMAAVDAARSKIAEAQAGVRQARGSLSGVTTARGYAEVRTLIGGVVTQRSLAPGVLVNAGQAILRVAQIAPIRLQANVAATDLARVRVGAPVVVHATDGSGASVAARVTSMAPSVDPVARTGVVEAVVPNQPVRFLPGQFVTMDITTGSARNVLRIPTAALRTRTPAEGVVATTASAYVWVAEPISGQRGQYTVRAADVTPGASDGTSTEIATGLSEGQQVVVQGAEGLQDGEPVADTSPPPAASTPSTMPGMPNMPSVTSTKTPTPAAANAATVEVSSRGFTPASVNLQAGKPARLTFIRKDVQNCATEIMLPEYHITRSLPLNQPVILQFTPHSGDIEFRCGMNMLHGKVVGR